VEGDKDDSAAKDIIGKRQTDVGTRIENHVL